VLVFWTQKTVKIVKTVENRNFTDFFLILGLGIKKNKEIDLKLFFNELNENFIYT